MKQLDNSLAQANSKLNKAYKGLMELAGKVESIRDQVIMGIVLIITCLKDLPITTRDFRLTFYFNHKMSTYDGKEKTFINVGTGKVVQCSTKSEGTPKTAAAVYVQEQLAKINKSCDGDLTVLLGWKDSEGRELAPSLRDVTEFTEQNKKVDKTTEQIEEPTKTVGHVVNEPAQTTHDISDAREQLKRLDTVLSKCPDEKLIKIWTSKILQLANSVCSEAMQQDTKKAA